MFLLAEYIKISINISTIVQTCNDILTYYSRFFARLSGWLCTKSTKKGDFRVKNAILTFRLLSVILQLVTSL